MSARADRFELLFLCAWLCVGLFGVCAMAWGIIYTVLGFFR